VRNALRFPIVLYLLLVFVSGAIVGVLAHNLYSSHAVRAERRPRSAEEYRRKYVEEMTARLKLADLQVKRLDEILDETRVRYREIRERVAPDFKAIQERQSEQIRAILEPVQVAEYEKMRAERERRRRERQSR